MFLCVSDFSVCRQPTAPSQQIYSNKLTSHRLLPDTKTKQNRLFTGTIQEVGTWKTSREVFSLRHCGNAVFLKKNSTGGFGVGGVSTRSHLGADHQYDHSSAPLGGKTGAGLIKIREHAAKHSEVFVQIEKKKHSEDRSFSHSMQTEAL